MSHDFDDPDSASVQRNLSLDAKYSRLLTPKLWLSARAYADSFDTRDLFNASSAYACPYLDVITCQYDARTASRWAGAELQGNYDWLGDARLTTLVGVDARARFVGTKQDVADLDTGEYLADSDGLVDNNDQTLGVYVQQIWWPVRELGLNAGARLDRDPRFAEVISPRAGASLAPWPGATLRSIYAEAFRAPNFYQSEYGDPLVARPGALQPETVRSVEASIEQRFGSHGVFFGVFRSWWRDLIELRFITFEEAQAAADQGLLQLALPGVVHSQHQNVAIIDNYGFNARVDGSFFAQRLRYGLNVTEAYSRRREHADTVSDLLPTAPRLMGNARLAYELPDPWPSVALAGYLLAPRLIDRGLDGGFRPTPFAPTQLDLRVTAAGRLAFAEGLSYRLSADYLFGNQGPYAIGWVVAGTPENPAAELSPMAPLRISIGLSYGFGGD